MPALVSRSRLRLPAQLDGGVGQVAHDGEQQFGHAADDLAIDERHRRRVAQVDADAAVLLQHLDVEIRIQLLRGARVVGGAAAGQHRQRATAQQVVHAAAGGIAQARDFIARQHVEAAARIDARVDGGQGGVGRCAGHSDVRRSWPRLYAVARSAARRRTKENGRVSPAVSVLACVCVDQNSYFRPTCSDHCEMPLVWPSALVGKPSAVAWPNSVPVR